MSDKQVIRVRALAARRDMGDRARTAADRALVAAAVEIVRGASIVAGYAPMRGEPGGAGLVPALASVVDILLLPVLLPDLDLDWARYRGGTPADLGAAPAPGPAGGTEGVAAIARASTVIVPAVAVDRTGTRLGRGGGSYDRALARVRPDTPVIALLYPGEVVDHLPREPHDRPVTAILTPDGLCSL